jgi:hypothetical protein
MFYGGFPTGDVLPGMFYKGFPTGDVLPGIFYRGFPTEDVLQKIFYRGRPTGDVLRKISYGKRSTQTVLQKDITTAKIASPVLNFTQNRSEVISKYNTPSTQMGTSSPPRHPPFTISTCSSYFRCSYLFFS